MKVAFELYCPDEPNLQSTVVYCDALGFEPATILTFVREMLIDPICAADCHTPFVRFATALQELAPSQSILIMAGGWDGEEFRPDVWVYIDYQRKRVHVNGHGYSFKAILGVDDDFMDKVMKGNPR